MMTRHQKGQQPESMAYVMLRGKLFLTGPTEAELWLSGNFRNGIDRDESHRNGL
jgi:hypothetical protein